MPDFTLNPYFRASRYEWTKNSIRCLVLAWRCVGFVRIPKIVSFLWRTRNSFVRFPFQAEFRGNDDFLSISYELRRGIANEQTTIEALVSIFCRQEKGAPISAGYSFSQVAFLGTTKLDLRFTSSLAREVYVGNVDKRRDTDTIHGVVANAAVDKPRLPRTSPWISLYFIQTIFFKLATSVVTRKRWIRR